MNGRQNVPWRGIEPRPRRWERRILATRPSRIFHDWYVVSISLITWYNFDLISQKERYYVIVVITMNDSRCGSTFIFAMIYLKGIYLWMLKVSIWFRQVIVNWSRWFSYTRLYCSHSIRTCDLPCTLLHCFKVNTYFWRLNLHTFLVYPFWYQVYPIVILVKARRALIC